MSISGFRYGFLGRCDSTIANPVLTAPSSCGVLNVALGVLTYRLLALGLEAQGLTTGASVHQWRWIARTR